MRDLIDAAIALVVLSNLRLLGTSRLVACIRIVALQGILLGLLPILFHAGDLTLRVTLQAGASSTRSSATRRRCSWAARSWASRSGWGGGSRSPSRPARSS